MTWLRELLVLSLLTALVACAPTQQVRTVEPSGFLGDYSMLREGGEGEPLLIYRNPHASLAAYDKVLIDPVTIWREGNSDLNDIPQKDLDRLALLLHVKIIEAVKRESYQIAHEPVPGVMHIQAAITEAQQSNRMLDTLSTALPQAHLLSGAQRLVTGTHSFVGKASVEAKITDAQTGELLVAGVDRGAGSKTLQGSTNSWDDVEQAFQFWADRFSYRLCKEHGKWPCVPPD